METQPKESTDKEENKATEAPPSTDAKKAAGSLNPKQKNAFYEAVVQKERRNRRPRGV
ncbi:MAG: hypothetical protein U1G07_17975 [Verrucomicrobiota bacterium]